MIHSINALILKTEKIEETANFYRALNLPLEKEQDDGGPVHYTCDLKGVHFAIYALEPYDGPERRSKTRDTMVGFLVENLDEALKELAKYDVDVILPVENVEWGRRAVVTDPDGRPVELNEFPEETQ